jgi:hypothetical protein
MDARTRLRSVLAEARLLLALPHNDFSRSTWRTQSEAMHKIDAIMSALDDGRPLDPIAVSALFAQTGPILKVGLDSGWAEEFLALASRYDDAAKAFFG